jgi:hypothetical protein
VVKSHGGAAASVALAVTPSKARQGRFGDADDPDATIVNEPNGAALMENRPPTVAPVAFAGGN